MSKIVYSPLKISSVSRRLLSYVIDFYLSGLLAGIGISCVQSIYKSEFVIDNSPLNMPYKYGCIASVIALVCLIAYFMFPCLVKNKSYQTIGQKVAGIEMVSTDGNSPKKKSVMIRTVWMLLVEAMLFSSVTYLSVILKTDLKNMIAIFLPVTFIGLLYGMINKKRQCLHDRISNVLIIEKRKE